MRRGNAAFRGTQIVVTVICAALMSSCSGDEPVPGTSASLVPAETATPEPSITKPPLQLWQPTQDSAVAFVKYFIDAYNYAYATYDTTILEQISEPTCTFCTAVVDEIHTLQKDQVTASGGQLSYVTAAFPEDVTDKGVYVLVVTDQRPGTTTAPDGAVSRTDGSRKAQIGFGLKWDGGRWSVVGITVQKKGQPW